MFFVCCNCGCVDTVFAGGDGNTCTECLTGEWHHMFEKEQFDPSCHTVDNAHNTQYQDLGEVSMG